ncbi:MAG: DUF393 domain-containing protein [Cyanobacteria bacterium SZAS LIN-2]|nr:DUF393 domain-containing protein [Cyanobacteria bacterium SZAS LIN-2]
MATYILFIFPEDLPRFWNWVKAQINARFGEPYKLAYDGDCIFCVRTVGLIHRLDIFGRIRPIDFRQEERSELGDIDLERAEKEILIKTRGANPQWLGGFNAFRFMCARLPLIAILTPFLYLPVISQLGEAVYKIIAANRMTILGGRCDHQSCKIAVG